MFLVYFKIVSSLLVPVISQGSVLRPILFNVYIIPLIHLISNPPVSLHTYADEIQLYVKCTENENVAPDILSSTITTIHNWLTINSLFFNPIKTEATFHFEVTLYNSPININGHLISIQHMSTILVLYLIILLICIDNCPMGNNLCAHNITTKL